MFLPWIILDWANEGCGAINSGGCHLVFQLINIVGFGK
jgi:hypothetical protein